MELPPIPFEIPDIMSYLPVQIPTMIHPAIVHFMVAIPVIVLFLEIVNIIMGKKAIGGVNFLLLFIVSVVSVGAYLTGLVDGKEAGVLSEAVKDELLEHKLMGTWLILASGVVLFFKFMSVVTQNGILRFFYLLVLAGFVAGVLTQGKEGGELVYKYGMNVQSDKIFDLEEKVEECNKVVVPQATPAVEEPTEEVIATPEEEVSTTVDETVSSVTTPE